MFRPIAMVVPDSNLIAEIILFGEGFGNTKVTINHAVYVYLLTHCCWETLVGVHRQTEQTPDQMPHNAASDQGLHCLLTEFFF